MYAKDKRDVLVVRLQDGTKINISRFAKRKRIGFSEAVRRLLDMALGRAKWTA